MNLLEIKDLSKTYGKTHALTHVSFSLQPGRIYGLLGRNGAGKTTLLHILGNRIFPTEGEALLSGLPVTENDEAQSQLYFLGEGMPYPEGMRVDEVLRLSRGFYAGFDRERAEALKGQFGLAGKKRIKSLSTGYATILKLIIALSCNARLLLLDEPVLGLDANHRELFYQAMLQAFAEGESTILLSTHLIEEVAEIVEHVFIIDHGRLLLDGSVEELRESVTAIAGAREAVAAAVAGKAVLSSRTLGMESVAYIRGGFETPPGNVRIHRPGLQELFVQLTSNEGGNE